MRQIGLLVTVIGVALGCGNPGTTSLPPATESARPAPKRITAALMSDPPTISSHYVTAGGGTLPGGDALEDLVNAGLVTVDNRGHLQAQLAEAVPSLDNGRWRMLPNGGMETSWTIRPGVTWHDGTLFSVEDVLFTARLARERELPLFREPAFDLIEQVEAPDARTVVVTWKQPYIQADALFTRRIAFPRPRHLLEQPYAESKESLTQLPYWTEEYVGTGPFRVRQWVRSSHVVLVANQSYVLGRPRLDEIEVRFIPNGNALVANLLSGEVQLTLGRNLSLKQAVQIREQWSEGQIGVGLKNWIALYAQQVNPNPAHLTNVQFRRGLLHALDRQQLVDTLLEGMVPVAHSFLAPSEPGYSEVESRIVRYDYEPRRSNQLFEELGYRKGSDGLLNDAAGQRLNLEVRTSAEDDTHEAGVFTVADFWRRAGISAESFLVPQAQRSDREYNATYPGVRLWRLPNDTDDLRRYTSAEVPRAETRFIGDNRSRYQNAALDALVDRYMSTIAEGPRTQLLGDIAHHMSDQIPVMGLWYNAEPVLMSRRLANIMVRDAGGTTEAWNAQEWDLR